MGKWATRLAEKTAAHPHTVTDKTDEWGVLSVLAVTAGGGGRDFQVQPDPANDSGEQGQAIDLGAVAREDADIAAFTDRRARLLRWGWTEPEAERLAERLVRRDREQDERVSCTDCLHYRPGRCGNHQRAGLNVPDVGRDLAALLQQCPGYQSVR